MYIMLKLLYLYLVQIFFLINTSFSIKANSSTVILVNVLLRHGERTPDEFYPTDPHKNNNFYPIGMGGLTNEGKLTEYNLGKMIKHEYVKLLGDHYTPNKLFVRSTEKVRAHMSALLVLAGMWPPEIRQQWHPTLLWQPIPVYYKPLIDEDLLDSALCGFTIASRPQYLRNNNVTGEFLKPHNKTFNYIEKHSGLKIKDLGDLLKFYFTIVTEKELGLVLPQWVERVYPNPMYNAVSKIYAYYNSNLKVKQINVGYLLDRMVKDCAAKINNTNSERVMYLYSAHDTTLGYFLNALTTTDHHIPSYGSAIFLELHKLDDKFYVKLRYLRTPKRSEIEDLEIPNCSILCPFKKFIDLNFDILPKISYQEACNQKRDLISNS